MSNPLLNNNFFNVSSENNRIMSLSGTINKSIILSVLLTISAFYSYMNPNIATSLLLPILIIAFCLSIVLVLKKSSATYLSSIYAICEGFIMGAVSLYFEKLFSGIVARSIFMTICVLFCMLAMYKSGILKVNSKFKKIVILSTFAISLFYIIDIVLGIFSIRNFSYIHDSSSLSVIVNFIIIVVAAFNLVIDFDLIENAVNYNSPKYMEWYCAFSLVVTLVWLYIEILRFFFKIERLKN